MEGEESLHIPVRILLIGKAGGEGDQTGKYSVPRLIDVTCIGKIPL